MGAAAEPLAAATMRGLSECTKCKGEGEGEEGEEEALLRRLQDQHANIPRAARTAPTEARAMMSGGVVKGEVGEKVGEWGGLPGFGSGVGGEKLFTSSDEEI